jgi:transcriptional regulator with XRE-family HTH domain
MIARNLADDDSAGLGPHRVDVHVGARVRMRRRMLDITQQKLAEAVGVTFQQIQKYEQGSNRISASKLYEIAQFLGAPISYFFEGLPEPGQDADMTGLQQKVAAFLQMPEGVGLIEALPRIRSAQVRRGMLAFAKTLADDTRSEEAAG